MSTPQAQLAQIKEENKRFLTAKVRGEITSAQFAQAMSAQKKREQQIKQSQTQSPLPSTGKYVEGDWKPIEEAPVEQQATLKAKTAPIAFYATYGQPELGLKYGVPEIPEGYEVAEVKEVLPSQVTRPPMSMKEALEPPQPYVEITLKQKETFVPTQLFGPTAILQDPITGEYYAAVTASKKAPRLIQTAQPSKSPSYIEQRATTGLGLATVIATGVSAPKLGAFALGGLTVAETGKVLITGEHLTPEEAISAAGIGMLIGAGVYAGTKALQPRVQRSLDASYRQAVESTELWKPSTLQRIGMKFTGAQPPRLASELVSAGESPPVSFQMLQKGQLGATEEAYFWDMPTPRSSEVYVARALGSRAKTWVGEHLIRRVSGGLSYALIQQELTKQITPEMPFIPKEPYILQAKDVLPTPIEYPTVVAGVSLASLLKSSQLTRQTTRQSLIQISKQEAVLSQVLGLDQSQMQEQTQQQKLSQAQVQTQMQKVTLIQQQEPQLLQVQTIAIPTFNLPSFQFPSQKIESSGFERFSLPIFAGTRKYRWEFPIVEPKEFMREWF